MAAWVREEENASNQGQKKREAEEADKVEVAPGVTVASLLRRFRTALIGPTQGLPKLRVWVHGCDPGRVSDGSWLALCQTLSIECPPFILACVFLYSCSIFFVVFCLFVFYFFCSHWSLVDVPLISFCPADHVPDWQPRIVLGMVEARSVDVKKATTTLQSDISRITTFRQDFRQEKYRSVCVCAFFPFILDIKFVGRYFKEKYENINLLSIHHKVCCFMTVVVR